MARARRAALKRPADPSSAFTRLGHLPYRQLLDRTEPADLPPFIFRWREDPRFRAIVEKPFPGPPETPAAIWKAHVALAAWSLLWQADLAFDPDLPEKTRESIRVGVDTIVDHVFGHSLVDEAQVAFLRTIDLTARWHRDRAAAMRGLPDDGCLDAAVLWFEHACGRYPATLDRVRLGQIAIAWGISPGETSSVWPEVKALADTVFLETPREGTWARMWRTVRKQWTTRDADWTRFRRLVRECAGVDRADT